MIKLFIGKMGSGKSSKLAEMVRSAINFDIDYIIISPSRIITSRNDDFVNVDILFNEFDRIDKFIEQDPLILVDECQWLTTEQVDKLISNFSNVYFFGLDEYVFNKKIDTIEYLKDTIKCREDWTVHKLHSSCRICNNKADLVIPHYTDKKLHKDLRYINLCNKCYEQLKETLNG